MKIIILDKIHLINYAVKSIIQKQFPYYIVETFNDFDDLKLYLEKHNADIIFMDIENHKRSGLDIVKFLNKNYLNLKIAVMTENKEERSIFQAVKNGAKAYMLKSELLPQTIIKAIEEIRQNKDFFSDTISNIILQNYVKNIKKGDEISQKKPRNLTRREIQILRLVCDGMTNRQIAEGLFISVRTVDAHKNHIMQKLGLKTTADLVKYAIKHGYIKL